ncbi:putative glycine-rich cell wall structural protein 1 [Forsythia ovata]|uniref:Glycine-rich cell wall structural protein 1 n=1 Tax=Forsythia ovata TaxID=205694 RepID=A0ABD1X8V8_9LAMI
MHHNIFQFSLILLFLISGHSETFKVGVDDGGQKIDSSKMSPGPSGAMKTNTEGSGSAHSPTSGYSWGWGSSPEGGWGYGSGSATIRKRHDMKSAGALIGLTCILTWGRP